MYIIHIYKCLTSKSYRQLVLKYELKEKYQSITYNWRKVYEESLQTSKTSKENV